MNHVILHDKSTIESFLRRNVYLHIYSIGDLDDFFWPYTIWYALMRKTEILEIALLYTGQTIPTLLALSEHPENMQYLLKSILHLLPHRFYAHLSPGAASALGNTYLLEDYGEHLKMALLQNPHMEQFTYPDVCMLGQDDESEIMGFFRQSYPENRFDPKMLITGQFYGIRKNSRLISMAGVHVYSPTYKVAALGNIATEPSHRNMGYGHKVTAGVCQALMEAACHIGLNVKSDNKAAISCYKKLGFEIVGSYHDYLAERNMTL